MSASMKDRTFKLTSAMREAVKTKKTVDVQSIFVLPIENIIKYDNPRHEPAKLYEQGYVLFGDEFVEKPSNEQKVSLFHLATSDDLEKVKLFVDLIEEYESIDRTKDILSPQSIVELAEDLFLYTQLLPILVRRHRNCYTMIDGGRRVAAILYLHAKSKITNQKLYPAIVNATELKCTDDELFMYSVKANLSRKGFTELQEGRVYHEMLKRINPVTGKKYNAKEAAAEFNVGYGTFRNREALWHPKRGNKGLTDDERKKVAEGKMNASYASKKSLGEKVQGNGTRKTTKIKPLSLKEMQRLFDATSTDNLERRQAIADCMGIKLAKAVAESMERFGNN